MGDRRAVYIAKDREKVCVLVTNGLFIRGQYMAKATAYKSLFTGSDNGCLICLYVLSVRGGQ